MDTIPQLQKQGRNIIVAPTSDGKHIIAATHDLQR